MSSEQTTSHRNPSRVSCCFATSLTFFIVVVTLCISLAVRLWDSSELNVHTTNQDSKDINRTISLNAVLVSADIVESTMLVDWVVGSDTCNVGCPEVNIFFDTNLSPSEDRCDNGGPSSNNRPTDPIFIWNATVGLNFFNDSSYDILGNSPTFRTKFIIYPFYTQFQHGVLIRRGSPASYPFDVYRSEVFAYAQEASTNKSVSLDLNSASPLIVDLRITISDAIEDYRDVDLGQGFIDVYVTLQRSTLVVVYCLIIIVTFWLVTLTICLIMITTVVFGYRQRNEIVVVPIGIVFAFTQLRSTMPGAPEGFGDVLDFVGLLPCLVLLSICAVTMVGIYVFTDPNDPSRKAFTWDELVNVLHCFKQRIWNTANKWVQWAQFRIRTARRKSSNIVEIPLTNPA